MVVWWVVVICGVATICLKALSSYTAYKERRTNEGRERETERQTDRQTDRQRELSNSKTLCYKVCSLDLVKNLTTSQSLLSY